MIGTHRLLSEDVRFKDLGLLVVDEEQRFGVPHKERIKKLRGRRRRADADGHADPAHARDEPDRDPRSLAAATRRRPTGSRSSPTSASTTSESSPRRSAASCSARARSSSSTTGSSTSSTRRRGCASWSPRPGSPWPTARWTRARSSRSSSTSGKGSYDVLVCTTIIESGIDMPTVNTMIVDRADLLGLASSTSCAAGSAAAGSGPTPTCSPRRSSR